MFFCVKLFFSKYLRRQSRERLFSFQKKVASEAMVVSSMFDKLSDDGKVYVKPAYDEMMALARRICFIRSPSEAKKNKFNWLRGEFFFTQQEAITYIVGAK